MTNNPAHGPVARFTKSLCMSVVLSQVTLGLAASSAWAQDEPSSADTAAARELAIEGLKLADAGHCINAIDKLRRAEKLRHSPIVLGRLGECQIELGKIVDGTENLQRLLHEPAPPKTTPNLLRARERAQTTLNAAKPKIAYLAISVRGPTENISVTVDGETVSEMLLGHDRPTDPGEHLIEATSPGYIVASRRLSVAAGEKQEVALSLSVDPKSAATPEAPVKKAVDGAPTNRTLVQSNQSDEKRSNEHAPVVESSPNRAPGYVLLTVGGATLATGGLFGYLAWDNKKALDNQCVNNTCPTSSKGTLDMANRYAKLSTVLMSAGAAGLAVGTILIWSAGSDSTRERSHSGVEARTYLGMGQVSVAGSF